MHAGRPTASASPTSAPAKRTATRHWRSSTWSAARRRVVAAAAAPHPGSDYAYPPRHRRWHRQGNVRRAWPCAAATIAPTRRRSAWMHADDGFDRAAAAHRDALLPLRIALHARCAGRRHRHFRAARLRRTRSGGRRVQVVAGRARRDPGRSCRRKRCLRSSATGVSADLHVHMNYGGHYRNDAEPPRAAGAGRRPRHRRQPARQQGRAHPRHRLVRRRRPRRRPRAPSRMRRSTTPASGATWGC